MSEELKNYYSDLLILQYRTQEKARATIGALVEQTGCGSGSYGKANYIVVGNPTIENGIASGFSKTNFLYLDTPIDQEVNSLEVKVKFKTGPSFNHSFEGIFGCANGSFSFYVTQEGVLRGVYVNEQGTHDNPIASNIQPNTTYWAKMLISTDTAVLSISTDGVLWNDTIYSSDDQRQINTQYFIMSCYPFTGSIDLNNTIIKINGESFYGYSLINVTLPQTIINGYDLNKAEGKQLDVLGKYIGLGRICKSLIGDSNTNVLNDSQYRNLLKLKLIKNTNFSSTSQIKAALYAWFPTSIRVYDNRNMTYDFQLSNFWKDVLNVIVSEDLLPVPMAIGYTATIVPNLLELYGYYDYGGLNNNPNGYSSYTDGFRGRYLSYGDKFAGDE